MKIKKMVVAILSFACLVALTPPLESFAASQSATVTHIHSATNTNPCYQKVQTGSHTEGNYYAYCSNCGDFISSTSNRGFVPHGSCSCGQRGCWVEKCGGEWSVADYGWILTCTHTNENLGILSISKDKKNLSVTVSSNPKFTITSYSWTGSATGNTASIVATKVGTATCVITVKDGYSGTTSNITLSVVLDQTDFYSATLTASKTSWTNKDVLLTCTATGEETISYQWYKDETFYKETDEDNISVPQKGEYCCIAVARSGATAQSDAINLYIDKIAPTLKLTIKEK